MGPCLLLNPLPIFWWPKKRPVFAKALPRSARWAYLRSWASKTGSPGCPWVPLRSLVRYGGFHSHGATPTAGWFISWKIHVGCVFLGGTPMTLHTKFRAHGLFGASPQWSQCGCGTHEIHRNPSWVPWICCKLTIDNLVGGWPTPLKNHGVSEFVSWNDDNDDIPNLWKVIIQPCSKPPTSVYIYMENHHAING